MIVSFGCKDTACVWKGKATRKWSNIVVKIALRKLFMLHAAENLGDLISPPGNKLHKLKGNMKEFWAIRINDQWRIKFRWKNSGAYDVQIIDYH
jgi:proteic killer suppression protein